MGIFGKNKNHENPDLKREESESRQKQGFWAKLAGGLLKTRSELGNKLGQLIQYYNNIDEEFYEELEAVLLSSDIGTAATEEIIERLRQKVKAEKKGDTKEIFALLREIISEIMAEDTPEESFPLLILVVGVNGVGKTTAIGKLAYKYASQGKKVLLAAGDTFRAAASEQLSIWAQRTGAQIVKHGEGADSAAVIFDAIAAGKARSSDVIICDTAGRLHNKANLMQELAKIGRIIDKNWEGARENFIVLDATTGQNAVSQVKTFKECVDITGIILTKLDGTAKGGVVIAIKQELDIPVRYIGVGEGKEDLMTFDSDAFAQNII